MLSKGCAGYWEMLRTEHTASESADEESQGTNLPKEGLSSAWDAQEGELLWAD